MSAYYNEFDPFAAQWLRNLIAANLIAPGDVDERSIVDVQPDDLLGYTQCHFFAGIGGWSYALRLARWDDNKPVWTGSCPCQPFSVAGKQDGHKDERHLYPEWSRLIRERKPPVIFGEQVEGAIRHGWLDAVQGDLEAESYAFGTAILGAHSVGAPHIRQRVWFVADARHKHLRGSAGCGEKTNWRPCAEIAGGSGDTYCSHPHICKWNGCQFGNPDDTGLEGRNLVGSGCTGELASGQAGMAGGMAYSGIERRQQNARSASAHEGSHGRERWNRSSESSDHVATGSSSNHWGNSEWLPCRDGKARPTQPGLFPLADGIPGRVGRLRAYGNAIVPQVAAEFIKAYMECRP